MDPQRELDRMADDAERAQHCQSKAEEMRRDYFRGEADVIGDLTRSKSGQYRLKSERELIAMARKRWADSVLAKDLLQRELFYSRWAGEYATMYHLQLAVAKEQANALRG
jgi:hypothetical protein